MTVDLADLPPGLADPVHHAQQSFRRVLDALAQPGRLQRLPADVVDPLQGPAARAGQPRWGRGLSAVLLTLLDAETSLHLGERLDTPEARAWLRFHTGVRLVAPAWRAAFMAARAADIEAATLDALDLGTDEAPQRGATLVIEVGQLDDASGPPPAGPSHTLRLRGPGVPGERRLRVTGVARAVWCRRIDLEAERPRGIDLLLVAGDTLAGLPRSTRIALDPER